MIHLTIAAWVTFGLVAVISALLLRLTVRIVAKESDNGWDNAIAYSVATLLLGYVVFLLVRTGSWFMISIAPLVIWVGQTIALRVIYEVKTLRAWAIGLVHSILTTTIVGALALVVGFVVAYVLLHQIITDPIRLIKLLLWLIGFDLPFDAS
jgi:hypothetical protein